MQVLFASLGVAMKLALRDLPPRAVIAGRMAAAALVFLLAWAVAGAERVAGRDLARIAVYALFGVVGNQLLFIEGVARTTATNAVVLGASIPIFTVLVALGSGRERATPRKLLGLGVALAGALSLAGVGRFGGGDLVGNGLVLANSLCYALYLVFSRDVLARYRTVTVVAFTFLFGAAVVVPLGAPALVRAAPSVSPDGWRVLAYLVLGPTVSSYLLTAFALARVPASLVAVYIYLQPVIGALLAYRVLGERPSWITFAAAAAIFAGIWLVGAGGGRRP